MMETSKSFRCIKSTLSRREESLQKMVAYKEALVLLLLRNDVRQNLRKRKATWTLQLDTGISNKVLN